MHHRQREKIFKGMISTKRTNYDDEINISESWNEMRQS